MIALILFLLMGPPPMVYGGDRQACAWWSKAEQRCRDEDVEVIGPWDPRPNPGEWQYSPAESAPPEFGAYVTEKRD